MPANDPSSVDVQAWFDVALEASPVGMGVISSIENRYLRVNQKLADLFGMTRDEILADDPYSLAQQVTHPDEMVAEQKLFAELAVGARASYQIEKRIRRTDGTMRWALATLSAIMGDGIDPTTQVRPLRYVVVQMVDITDQKTQTETLQRMEGELRHAQKIDGIGRLAAGIAHDFNNLLTVIMGHAAVLREVAEPAAGAPAPAEPTVMAEMKEGLDAILAACARAASLTAQVLAHGRRERVVPRAFVLSDAVRDLQLLLGRTIGSDIRVDTSLTAQGAVFADQGQIGQVVMNLVLNARDAIPEGGRITLTTRDMEDGAGPPGPGAWVALAVRDDGHGMSPETQARIFEPFFTTRTDRPGTQGTGLGLATVQRIVKEAGGHIAVESAPGRGTTVTVFFPRVALTPPKSASADEPRRGGPPPNTQRVLVVEDEPSVRSLVANVLLGAHYLVAVARDGADALRLLETEREPFHLIVADLVMPGMGGMTLARHLQKQGSRARVVFISGYSDHPQGDLAALGPLLPKPFTPAQLLDAVRRGIDGER